MFHVEHSSEALPNSPAALLMEGSLKLGVPCSPHVACRFVLYLTELIRWNAKVNLTALETETEIISKHFLDSLAAFKLFEGRPGLRILDVGSGAGFPGIVLKMQAPELAMTLLEPSTKKAAFLHHIVGILGIIGIKIVTTRVEDFTGETFDLITCRAIRSDVVLAAAPRLLAPGGRILLYRVSPLVEWPLNFQISNQITFSLPFLNAPRTLTLLKQTNDSARSEFTSLIVLP
jgi:16S rRNA (guanine527-N7)-methyltransferase